MNGVWLAIVLIALGIATAMAMPPEQQIIMFGGQSSAGNLPQPTGDILMVDGTSLILQTNGTSFVCRAGGC